MKQQIIVELHALCPIDEIILLQMRKYEFRAYHNMLLG